MNMFDLHSLPHGRGDVSASSYAFPSPMRSSPRAWGCFQILHPRRGGHYVFPTGVGMFLTKDDRVKDAYSLPHGRGDVSEFDGFSRSQRESSPRAWGCFLMPSFLSSIRDVFPTGVGMFL